MSDYPDWQTFPNAQSGNLFAGYSQTLTPGLHTGTMLPAVSWSSLIVIVDPLAGACQVQVGHFADLAGTQEIDSDTWAANAATALIVRTPLRGTYVRVDIDVTSGTNLTAVTWANFLSATSDRISFPVGTQNLSDYDHVLAASGTKTYNSGEIAAGQAYMYFKPYDATGKLACVLHAVDELGNPGQLIADFGTPTALTAQLIMVPDKILQVEVANNDATAAHTYDFSLTVPPQ